MTKEEIRLKYGPEPPRRDVVERIKALGGSAEGLKTQVEAQARLDALEEELAAAKAAVKPKVVVAEGEVVEPAVVRVSKADPNYRKAGDGLVRVGPFQGHIYEQMYWQAVDRIMNPPPRPRVVSDYNPWSRERMGGGDD
jgi:hypothetical protein